MDPLNILLIDDDRNLVTTLSYGLRKAMQDPVSVATCFSGSEALSLLATQPFDVIVSDFNMPGMSGLELLQRIRQEHGEWVLVLSTAYGTDALEEGARQLGVGYITKPFEPSLLAQLIKELIRGEGTRNKQESVSLATQQLGRPAGSSQSVRMERKLHE
jgi:two-component system response regulator FlrC